MTERAVAALAWLTLGASACGTPAPRREAGAAIAPRLALAFTLPSGAIEFSGQGDADVTSDGRIAVLDSRAHIVYLFDTSGAVTSTLGRQGPGPGEIMASFHLATGPNGEVALADVDANRITIWSRAGTLIQTAVSREGGLLFDLWWVGSGLYARVYSRQGTMVGRFDLSQGTLDSPIPPPREVRAGAGAPEPCTYCAVTVSPGGQVIYGAPDTLYRLDEVDRSGTVQRTWSRANLPAVRYSATEREAFARSMRVGAAVAGGSAPAVPEFKVRFRAGTVAVDSVGRLWALPSHAEHGPSVFDVFAPEGRLLTSIALPLSVETFKVRHGWLVALGESTEGEPRVLVFRVLGAAQ